MRKTFLLLFLTLIIFVPQVSAHVLETENSIGGVLHIEPEDNPIAGEPSAIILDIKDTQNKFSSTNCNCTLTILENNQVITTQPFSSTPDSQTAITTSFTFPQTDIYKIKISGIPFQPDSFTPFNLEYDIRVARSSSQITSTSSPTNPLLNWISSHLINILIIGILIIIIIWLLAKKIIKKNE